MLRQLSYEMGHPHTHPDEDFQKITAPTLVITGDRDQFLPLEHTLALFRMIPGAEFAVVPGVDHFSPGPSHSSSPVLCWNSC